MTREAGYPGRLFEHVMFDGLVESARGGTLEDAMQTISVPGLSVAAVVGGELLWSEGWGVTNTLAPGDVGPSTRFQAGSISKSVASLVALRLVAEGRFGLDDDVNEVAGCSLLTTAQDSWRPKVSVRQLLAHTAGTNVGGFAGYAASEFPTGLEIIHGSTRANTQPIRVIGVPGTRHVYSGGGYVVLQEMIASTCQAPFDEIASDVLLVPAGMTRSTFRQDGEDADRSSGHREGGGPIAGDFRRYPEMAAAGLWTTAADLGLFVAAIMRAHRGDAAGLIPRDLAREMLTPQSDAEYGLGLRVSRPGDPAWFGHGGDTQGFEADVFGTLDGFGVAVMANSDMSRGVINAIRTAVARLHESSFVPRVRPLSTAATMAPPHGQFIDRQGHRLDFKESQGVLTVAIDDQPPLSLSWDGRSAWTSDELNVTVSFDGSKSVRVSQTMHHGPVAAIEATAI